MNKWDIANYNDPRDKDANGITDNAEREAAPNLDMTLEEAHGIQENFGDKVLDTLKGRNGTGKAIYGVGTAILGVLTGINIEPLTDLFLTQQSPTAMDFLTDINVWTILFAALSAGLGFLKTKADRAKTEAEKARDNAITQAQLGLQLLSQAKSADSDKGTKISTAEKDRIIEQAETVFSSIVDYGEAVVIGKLSDERYGLKANKVYVKGNHD